MVYNYTQPRRPVMSSYSGPGPCYALPGLMGQNDHDPRSVHARAPGYKFGLKHGSYKDDCGPGPAYGSMEKIYRNGKELPPSYSMAWRPRTAPLSRHPGPADYTPMKSLYRAPSYAFGLKTASKRTDRTPGPNHYDTLEKITVQSGKRRTPAYTMCGKQYHGSFYEDKAKTPGPSAYAQVHLEVYKARNPGYTIVGRNIIPSDNTRKPGPGQYSPEASIKPRSAPRYTFGLRHSSYEASLIIDPVD